VRGEPAAGVELNECLDLSRGEPDAMSELGEACRLLGVPQLFREFLVPDLLGHLEPVILGLVRHAERLVESGLLGRRGVRARRDDALGGNHLFQGHVGANEGLGVGELLLERFGAAEDLGPPGDKLAVRA
jgi:hypothetical protein